METAFRNHHAGAAGTGLGWKGGLLMVVLGFFVVGFASAADAGPIGDPRPARVANQILPLSNGLSFELVLPAVIERYGPPVSDEQPSALPFRQLTFRDFAATFDRESGRLTAIRLINGVALASGLKVGSPWSEAVAEFGREIEAEDAVQVEVSGLLVSLERDGSVVSSIRIRRSSRAKAGAGTAKLRAPLTDGAGASRLEPFSNGVLLSDPLEVVLAKLGPPEKDDRTHPAVRALIYKDAVLLFDARDRGFNRAVLRGTGVKLACGVTVGTAESEVKQLLPSARQPIQGAAYQYSEPGCVVRIAITDGRVEQIELRRMEVAAAPNRGPR
jgi:hypothetical protein